jgi:hypothetical protein
MKEPFGDGSIRRTGERWLLDAVRVDEQSRGQLVLHSVRPALTIGPLPSPRGAERPRPAMFLARRQR